MLSRKMVSHNDNKTSNTHDEKDNDNRIGPMKSLKKTHQDQFNTQQKLRNNNMFLIKINHTEQHRPKND